MINIALLASKRAIYVKRETEIVRHSEEVTFCFQNHRYEAIPNGLTAIFFKENGQSLYRDIVGGQCQVPARYLVGLTQIRVTDIKNWRSDEVWDTESMVGKLLDDVYLVLQPAETDVAKELMNLSLELDKARAETAELKEKIKKTNERLTKAFEGWDIE